MDDFSIDTSEKVATKLQLVDSIIGGEFTTALHMISGGTGCGKTALLLQIVEDNPEIPSVYLNLEMKPGDLNKRIVSRTTDTPIGTFSTLPKDEVVRLAEITKAKISHLKILDGKTGYISFDYLKNTIEGIIADRSTDTVLLVIDSFNQWVETAKDEYSTLSKEEIASQLITKLLDIASEKNITIICSAQKTPESGAINSKLEYAADTHIEMSWELSGRVDSDGLKRSKFFFTKNRNGQQKVNTIVKFDGDKQSFK